MKKITIIIVLSILTFTCSNEEQQIEKQQIVRERAPVTKKQTTPKDDVARIAVEIAKKHYTTLFNSPITKDIKNINVRYSTIGSYEYDRLYKEFGWVKYVTFEVEMQPRPSPGNVQYDVFGNTFHFMLGTGNKNGIEIIKSISPYNVESGINKGNNVFFEIPANAFTLYNEIMSKIPLPDYLTEH